MLANGVVGAGVWCVTTLVSGALIIRSTLDGVWVSNLGGAIFFVARPPLEVNQVCLGGLEIETPIVLGILTVFRHFLKMVP